MARPERNGVCKTCGGRIRHYPAPALVADDSPGRWAHMDPADWKSNPHEADPTEASIAAAGVVTG